MLTAIIVDDEPHCCETITVLLETFCPDIEILCSCNSAREAIESIGRLKPDIVFLDIEMPHMNGFEVLEKLGPSGINVIFTTSHDQYAIKAFRFSAVDYLLKPVDREDLQKAVQKIKGHKAAITPGQLEILLQKYRQPAMAISKIAIPTMEGLQLILMQNIISCKAESNYTVLHLKNKQKITSSRTLKEIEEMLEDKLFVRVHHSWVVNVNEIDKYIRGDGGYLQMTDGSSIDVSRSRRDPLLKKIQPGK
jgi:two-component system, LytTR family, response regulator